jgi:ribose transport system substrate-binding protein
MSRRDFLRLGGISLAAGAVLFLPGCQPAPGAEVTTGETELLAGMIDTSSYQKASPWTVGRAGSGDLNAWMVMFSAHFEYGIKEKYKDLFRDYFVTAANFDPAKQISDVEDLLSRNIQLLFIDPVAEAPLTPVVEQAMNRGIPVVLASTRVTTDKYVTWVSRNNTQTGFLYADYMGQQLNGEGKVVLLMGFAGSSYAEDVLRGVRQGLSNFPGIEEVGMANANWSPTDAKAAMEAFIQSNPQIDGVIADGGQMALGAVDALLDAGRAIPPITGDEWNGWLRRAKELDIEFMAVSAGQPLSLIAVDQAVKILQGEPVIKNVEYPITTFTQDELDNYYREDLSDQYWGIHDLPEDWIQRLYG